jgi:hypothetical protein
MRAGGAATADRSNSCRVLAGDADAADRSNIRRVRAGGAGDADRITSRQCVCLLLQDLVQNCLHLPVQAMQVLFEEATPVAVCVFITAGPSTKLFTWGGGGIWEDMCYYLPGIYSINHLTGTLYCQ